MQECVELNRVVQACLSRKGWCRNGRIEVGGGGMNRMDQGGAGISM